MTIWSQSSNCVPTPPGLISWWRAEGNANDSAGGNSGILNGSLSFVTGRVGQAFSFNGINADVRVAASASLNVGVGDGFTIEAWINPASVAEQRPIIEWNNGAYGVNLWLQDTNSGGSGLGLNITDTSLQDHIIRTTPGSITAGIYRHVAATYNKTNGIAVLYINGAMAVQASVGTFTPTTLGDLYFGLRPAGPGAGFRFQGSMDEISLYSQALSAVEIQAIYQAGSAGKCTGPSAPVIVAQPTNQTVAVGADATFRLTALGTAPLAYQWLFYGTNIVGATDSMLVITNVQSSNAGPYSAIVTNQYGAATSAVATLMVGTSSACLPAPAGLVSWWRAEGNSLDAGSGSHGALIGNATYGPGRVGQAFVFDGNDDAAQVGNPTSLQLQDFTIETWIKRASSNIASFDFNGGIIFGYGPGGYNFAMRDDGTPFLGRVTVDLVTPNVKITDTNLHHVAVTKFGTSVIFYVDGVAYPAPSYSSIFTFTTPAAIGARGDNSVNSFYGLIDDLTVYNRALSASEIQTIHQAGSAGKCEPPCAPQPANLVSWWRAEGNSLDSGSVNGGVLIGNAAYGSGRVGQTFVFDGSGDAVLLGTPTSLQLQNFTIETWIKRASALSVSLDNALFGNLLCWGDGGYALGLRNDGQLYLSKAGISSVGVDNVVTDTNWHHVAVTKSGSTVIFYVDGVAHPAPAYDPGFTFSTPVAIGAHGGSLLGSFFGSIDEMAVYSLALSASEIQAVYQAASAGKCTKPTAPVIIAQPTNRTAAVGGTATFTVGALGTSPLAYQWRFGGTNIFGATNLVFTFSNVQFSNEGSYSVVVTNLYGSATSSNGQLTVSPAPPCVSSPEGLVGWWKAEGNAQDYLGINHGTPANQAGFVPGQVGQAFIFDGNGDIVQLTNSPLFQLQDFTIECWIRRANTFVASFGANGHGAFFGYGQGGYLFLMNAEGRLLLSKTGTDAIFSSTAVTDLEDHHVAVTKSGTAVTFYVDGFPDHVPVYNSTFAFTTTAAIGGRGDNLGNSFYGSIDELAIYSRPLSTNEIRSIYNASVAGKCNIPIPITIVAHPQNSTVVAGASASFSVVAAGSATLNYQWHFNGANIAGATNASLLITSVQFVNAGNYSVRVTNVAGSVISSNALLAVNLPTPVVRIGSTSVMAGAQFSLPVTLAANGNENALGFSFTFNTQRLALASVELGSGAAGATMLVNYSQVWTGRVGVALAYPPQSTFSAGTQEVARLNLYAWPLLGPSVNSTIATGDQPVLRELLSGQLQTITANYNNGVVTLLPTVFESDVMPRPSGNQAVSTADWLQVSRYVARLDTPTNSAEFQRADSSPRVTLGDGQLKVTDWVQAGRNLSGLDPLLAIGGPTNEIAPVLAGPSASRLVRMINTHVVHGGNTTISVFLDSQGDENALGFTLNFDPLALGLESVVPGMDATTATLQANLQQAAAGRLGVALALPTGDAFDLGNREVLRLTVSGLQTGSFPITLGDQIVTRSVSDRFAGELPTSFIHGTLTIRPLLTSPLISITQSGTNVVLSWPIEAAGFTLQSMDSASGFSQNWSNTPATIQTNSGAVFVILPVTNQVRFFRLVYP